MVSRDLLAQPVRRLELIRLLLGWKLDLGDNQSLQVALVDVDFDPQALVRENVASLPKPTALGQRPETVEPLAVELDLGFLA